MQNVGASYVTSFFESVIYKFTRAEKTNYLSKLAVEEISFVPMPTLINSSTASWQKMPFISFPVAYEIINFNDQISSFPTTDPQLIVWYKTSGFDYWLAVYCTSIFDAEVESHVKAKNYASGCWANRSSGNGG